MALNSIKVNLVNWLEENSVFMNIAHRKNLFT